MARPPPPNTHRLLYSLWILLCVKTDILRVLDAALPAAKAGTWRWARRWAWGRSRRGWAWLGSLGSGRAFGRSWGRMPRTSRRRPWARGRSWPWWRSLRPRGTFFWIELSEVTLEVVLKTKVSPELAKADGPEVWTQRVAEVLDGAREPRLRRPVVLAGHGVVRARVVRRKLDHRGTGLEG